VSASISLTIYSINSCDEGDNEKNIRLKKPKNIYKKHTDRINASDMNTWR